MHSSTFMISGSNNNSTNQTNSPIEDLALLIGCSFLWGSTFIPVKQYETGDGLFFQMIFGLGIWSVGLVVYWIRNFPKYYALPMFGGFLFAVSFKQFFISFCIKLKRVKREYNRKNDFYDYSY